MIPAGCRRPTPGMGSRLSPIPAADTNPDGGAVAQTDFGLPVGKRWISRRQSQISTPQLVLGSGLLSTNHVELNNKWNACCWLWVTHTTAKLASANGRTRTGSPSRRCHHILGAISPVECQSDLSYGTSLPSPRPTMRYPKQLRCEGCIFVTTEPAQSLSLTQSARPRGVVGGASGRSPVPDRQRSRRQRGQDRPDRANSDGVLGVVSGD